MSTDWIRVNKAPPVLGFPVLVWNGGPGLARPILRNKVLLFLDASTSIPIKGVTHYAVVIAPDETP